jgi:hypothetical protein
MPNFSRWNEKDADGRWFTFDHQQLGNSCGPASIKITKESVHNKKMAEEYSRAVVALFKHDKAHSGTTAAQMNADVGTHDWETRGALSTDLLNAMKSNPLAIKDAKKITGGYANAFRSASRHHPVLISWRWAGPGAHWNVCMGAQRSNPDMVTLLDPYYGIQSLDISGAGNPNLRYRPDAHSEGRIQVAITT